MSQGRLQLTLDLDPSSEPLSGTLEEPGRPVRSFEGWIGLTGALQEALARAGARRVPGNRKRGRGARNGGGERG